MRPTAACLLVLLLTGCSSFHGAWRRTRPPIAYPDSLAGRWEGEWRSDKNGHHGALRAVFAQGGTGTYQASFHGVWWRVFGSAYDVEITVTPQPDGSLALAGERQLFPLGAYRIEGEARDGVITARYASKLDGGVMELHRAP